MASSSAPQRNGKGRKKVIMAKMENKSNLQVTFTKRRNGLFKKASELCTLTGSEVGVLVFSPGNNVFSFGHPSVSRVMDMCFPEGEKDEFLMRYDESLMDAYRSFNMVELNTELTRVDLQLEAEKQRAVAIGEREKMELQWKPPIENMMQPQLNEMGACLRAFKDAVMRTTNIVGGMTDPGLNPVRIPSMGMNPVDRPTPVPDMGNVALNSMDVLNPDQNIFDLDMNNPSMNTMGGPDPDMGDLGVHDGCSGFKYW